MSKQSSQRGLARALALALCLVAGASAVSAAEAEYADVAPDTWYYGAVSAWSGAGILKGYGGGRFGPDDAMRGHDLDIVLARLLGGDEPVWRDSAPVSREAAAKSLALALGLEPVAEPEALYGDDAAISDQFRAWVYALRESGVQQGMPGNEYSPQGTFTRAELIQSAYNAVSAIADADVSDKTYEKTLIVRKPDLTIKDSAIKGDLIVGHGVGDGDLTLDNVSVGGRVVVYGGGSHSIIVKNGSKIAALVAGKPNVHIQLENGASVQSIEIVEDNVQITVSRGATVETLIIDAGGAAVEGGGTLARVTVKPEAVGAVVTTPNTIIVNDSRDYVTTANGVVKAGETQTPPTTTPGGGGTSGGGGYPSTPAPTPSPKPEIVDVEVSTADKLVELIKGGTENVRIVVAADMEVTKDLVGEYEPFGVYDLLLRDNVDSILYIPENVTLTIESEVSLRIGGDTELAIDGTLNVHGFWVGGKLTVNLGGELVCDNYSGITFSKYATVGGTSPSIAGITFPEKSYEYNIGYKYVDGVYTDANIYWADVGTQQQLLDVITDKLTNFNIYGSFDITSPVSPPIWVIEDLAKITIKSDFTVQNTLNVAGEIAGAEGGKVIIPANAQIKNVLWGGGWISEENGTGVLHGLPVDKADYERVYVWQGGAWVVEAQ
jgi:hypothetical protein